MFQAVTSFEYIACLLLLLICWGNAKEINGKVFSSFNIYNVNVAAFSDHLTVYLNVMLRSYCDFQNLFLL